MNNIGISIGWNCHSAVWGVHNGVRHSKLNGYETCPFDEMITNYHGMIKCIQDDFKYLYDPNVLELVRIPIESKWLNTNGDGDIIIRNNKYNFIFNHESPGHANLYKTQNWKGGITHYIDNNYAKLIERYERRTHNFKNYLADSNNKISFILTRPTSNNNSAFEYMIGVKYPTLNYNIINLDFDGSILSDHLQLMGESELRNQTIQ